MRKRFMMTIAAGVLGGALVLTGCSTGGDQDQSTPSSSSQHQGHGGSSSTGSGGEMEHPMDGGPAPAGIEKAASPKYPVGTQVILTADHMMGMDGAKATIVGAYDTYTYAIDYTPVGGGDPVTDHKWVVHEELEGHGEAQVADVGARLRGEPTDVDAHPAGDARDEVPDLAGGRVVQSESHAAESTRRTSTPGRCRPGVDVRTHRRRAQ